MAHETRSTLSELSDQLADAVKAASLFTVRIQGRRGMAASGIALGPELVATADHVIDPAREDHLVVGLANGREVAATVAGRDSSTDLSILRVPGAQLVAAPAGPAPRPGALVLLVARPGDQPAASLGLIVSHGGPARTRRGGVLERYYQVDATMYPGFSGGPLVNTEGAVVGLNTSGLSFGGPSVAIPWDLVQALADVMLKHGRVPRGYLGIGSQPIQLSEAARTVAGGRERGLLVVQVAPGGPAAQAGILQGDILVSLGPSAVESPDDLQGMLGPERVGTAVPATVIRGGERRDLTITVGTRDSERP